MLRDIFQHGVQPAELMTGTACRFGYDLTRPLKTLSEQYSPSRVSVRFVTMNLREMRYLEICFRTLYQRIDHSTREANRDSDAQVDDVEINNW